MEATGSSETLVNTSNITRHRTTDQHLKISIVERLQLFHLKFQNMEEVSFNCHCKITYSKLQRTMLLNEIAGVHRFRHSRLTQPIIYHLDRLKFYVSYECITKNHTTNYSVPPRTLVHTVNSRKSHIFTSCVVHSIRKGYAARCAVRFRQLLRHDYETGCLNTVL
jgi:hypothetical protein